MSECASCIVNSKTPLMEFFSSRKPGEISLNDLAVTEMLVREGENVNAIYNRETVLIYVINAAVSASTLLYKVVKTIIDAGARECDGAKSVREHFEDAAIDGYKIHSANNIIYRKIRRMLYCTGYKISTVETPLMQLFSNDTRTITWSDVEEVKRIITAGVDVNAIVDGKTALAYAVDATSRLSREFYEVVLLLIKAGANVYLGDNSPILHFVSREISTQGKYYDRIYNALIAEHTDFEELIIPSLENGHPIDIPLQYSVKCHFLKDPIGTILNSKKLVMQERNTVYTSRFHMAARVVIAGCDLSYIDDEGNTTLMVAAACNNYLVEAILTRSNDNILARNNYGETALMIAMSKYDKSSFDMLLKHGADEEGDALIRSLHLVFSSSMTYPMFLEPILNSVQSLNQCKHEFREVLDFYIKHYSHNEEKRKVFEKIADKVRPLWTRRNRRKLSDAYYKRIYVQYWLHISAKYESKIFSKLKNTYKPNLKRRHSL